MTEWQPIETAPKDGTKFLAFTPATKDATAFIHIYSFHSEYGLIPRSILIEPTHWMPLPEFPK